MSEKTEELTMQVQFTQTFTLYPPDSIRDRVMADEWFNQAPEMRLRDALDVRQGDVEVLSISGGDDQ